MTSAVKGVEGSGLFVRVLKGRKSRVYVPMIDKLKKVF
jgi:hypothetical protein